MDAGLFLKEAPWETIEDDLNEGKVPRAIICVFSRREDEKQREGRLEEMTSNEST